MLLVMLMSYFVHVKYLLKPRQTSSSRGVVVRIHHLIHHFHLTKGRLQFFMPLSRLIMVMRMMTGGSEKGTYHVIICIK